ncbi:hypothetical protein F9288_11275 [Sphingomonas sp. CL5.1]|uniref:hypothetical protein n=1 Tax=Sphingomonas sp. CL5.1 TaxID=2653203 RepID=UPI001583B3AE|nr:hypothetical protein [Sphingomonas sp. CL5.1]QKS00143.1 hypothetical protein F9288_11275 [Sphingomonas sp. CL5.1]
MIALLLALLADPPPPLPASIDGSPISGLATQSLPARGCAAYLFSTGSTRVLAAMAMADPAGIRLALDGVVADYPRVGQSGSPDLGFAPVSEYRLGEVTVRLELAVTHRADLADGALISSATLRIDRGAKDGIIMPLGGLIGCAKK